VTRRAAGLWLGASALGAGLLAAATLRPRALVQVTFQPVGTLESTHRSALGTRQRVDLQVSSPHGPATVKTLPVDPPGRQVEPGTGRRSVLLAPQGATQFQASEVLEPGPWVVIVRSAQDRPPQAEPATVSVKVSVH